ncbi:VOC family protein [Actinokineospora sp. UTMC 2448]|uniref:VOC family protein n=1 Tax=Actinokineospora sp. UTMC 2448 TaxID=2268449 RepID=UPI002164E2F6|nr:VOC family protein [Actinokineospora sp. UTMC 2448]UVS81102.1 27 kDa antigen Cfp30B [Actinokineospora sp. UTMC 2448]
MVTDAISAAEDLPEGTPGKPCWVEVATRDPAGSAAFYGALFGWEFRIGDDGYRVALVDGVPVAGLYTPQGDQPGEWTLYLTIHDTHNTEERVRLLGGEILAAPREIPGQGGLLVATDPSGGPIGFWRQDRGWALGTGFPGAFTWAELYTWDGAAADAFYTALFGFETTQIGDGTVYDYTTWSMNGEDVLGRLRMGKEFPRERPPYWMVFFEAAPEIGVDALAEKAAALGGTVAVPPFDSPYGRTAVLRDPRGAEFSVLDRAVTIEADESEIGAEVDDPYAD